MEGNLSPDRRGCQITWFRLQSRHQLAIIMCKKNYFRPFRGHLMILGINFTFQDRRSRTAFLRQLQLYYHLFLYNWYFSRYSAPIHWLAHGHMTSNNETQYFPPNAMSGQHCENYDVKRETVCCDQQNVDCCCTWPEVAWCFRWNLSAFFKMCFYLTIGSW